MSKKDRQSPLQDRLLLTVDEAVEVTSYSRGFLYKKMLAGEIPSITTGRTRRIPAEALRAWIAKQVELANPAAANR